MPLVEAPIFHPTEAEWADPVQYINKIEEIAGKHGICKVIPPASFRPDFMLERSKVEFKTRIQNFSFIEATGRVEKLFHVCLRVFWFENNLPMPRRLIILSPTQRETFEIRAFKLTTDQSSISKTYLPKFSDQKLQPLIFYRLYVACELVRRSHPFQQTSFFQLVAQYLFKDKYTLEDVSNIESFHNQYLELFYTRFGSDWFTTFREKSVTKIKSPALVAKLHIKAAGVSKARFSAIHIDPAQEDVIAEEAKVLEDVKVRKGVLYFKYFPNEGKCYRGRVTERRQGMVVTKFHTPDRKDFFDEEYTEEETRQFIFCGEDEEEAEAAYKLGICQSCQRANKASDFIFCEICKNPIHATSPCTNFLNAKKYKEVDYFCIDCLDDESFFKLSHFGFEEGPEYTISEYKALDDLILNDFDITESEDFEKEYFIRMAETKNPSEEVYHKDLQVQYGSDLDTSVIGSGFPTKAYVNQKFVKLPRSDKHTLRKMSFDATDTKSKFARLKRLQHYASHEWNLNNIPTSQGSLLRFVDEKITGINVPWLYMGMKYSTFCFHTEDHYFASMSYHHTGAPKSWFGVSSSQAELFESACRKVAPELFDSATDLLTGIVTQFKVDYLLRVCPELKISQAKQEPNNFIITFPRAYHAGLNHGFNCAEAVNFATKSWVPFGWLSFLRYKSLKKPPLMNYPQFVWELGIKGQLGEIDEQAKHNLIPVLKRFLEIELSVSLRQKQITQYKKADRELVDGSCHCHSCKTNLYFSCLLINDQRYCLDENCSTSSNLGVMLIHITPREIGSLIMGLQTATHHSKYIKLDPKTSVCIEVP